MTDNRTTELRISEPLRGFIRHQSNRAYIDGGQARWLTKIADDIDAKNEQAVAAWNARAEQTCRNVHEEWEKTSFAGAETSFCCSECGAHYFDAESYYAGLADADGDLIRTNYCPNCGARVVA